MSLPKLEEARAGVVVRASEFPLDDRRVGGSRLDCKIPGHFKAVPLKKLTWIHGYTLTRVFNGYVASGVWPTLLKNKV